MDWSNFQQAIYDEVEQSPENLIIQACAGSGKSTTLFEVAKIERRKDKVVVFLAFNKGIADYARDKLGTNPKLVVKTFHAHGLQTLKKFVGVADDTKIDVVKSRVRRVVNKELPKFKYKNKFWPVPLVTKCISKIRMLGIMTYEREELYEFLMSLTGIFSYNPTNAADEKFWLKNNMVKIQKILKAMDKLPTAKEVNSDGVYTIDFDDMVRLPCIHNMLSKTRVFGDTFLIDEGQDMSPYQENMIEQIYNHEKKMRLVICGDRNQAIYGFRGAFVDSLDRLKDVTKATELPLSMTYRTGNDIVDWVNTTIPNSEMEAFREGGKINEILKANIVSYVQENEVKMIVGAKNASLMEVWILLAINNIGSTLKGTGIAEELRKLKEDYKPENIQDFLDKIMDASLQTYVLNEDTGESICALPDKVMELIHCAQILIQKLNLTTLSDYDNLLMDMELSSDIHLHTVHSAKGLESSNVLVLEDWFVSDQTTNMRYVAYTRCEDSLGLVVDFANGGKDDV